MLFTELLIDQQVIRHVILPYLSARCIVNLIDAYIDHDTNMTQKDKELIDYAFSRLNKAPKRKTYKGRMTELTQLAEALCCHCGEVPSRARPWVRFMNAAEDADAAEDTDAPTSLIRLCAACKVLPEYKLICKTTALRTYKVKQDQLNNLPCIKAKNPHYSCAATMVLYLERDVIEHQTHASDVRARHSRSRLT